MGERIMVISHSAGGGGSERVASLLANYLTLSGNEVYFYALHCDKKDYFLDPKLNYYYYETNKKSKIMRWFERGLHLRKYIKENKINKIISFVYFECLFFINDKNIKKIFSLRSDPNSFYNKGILKIARDFMYSKADNIVFQTNDAKNYFSKKIQAKSVVIPNPIKSNLPYWNKENFNKEIITACRMTAQKNLKMLLDSFNIFSKKNGEYILSIYGEGEELNSLVSYAKEIGINDKVFFRGYCIDVHNKIKDSAIFVMTSDYEGISNAMLEALAIGIPTICTDCPIGGARQFIKDGVNGFLVPVRDYKMFSEKMDYLVNDKELMLSFYSNAIKIRDELEVKKILSRWEELL